MRSLQVNAQTAEDGTSRHSAQPLAVDSLGEYQPVSQADGSDGTEAAQAPAFGYATAFGSLIAHVEIALAYMESSVLSGDAEVLLRRAIREARKSLEVSR